MNYPDSVQFLYALGNEYKTIKFGLERIRTLLAALGDPQQACRFVHVAGTNGKGSTCAMIASALRTAGIRTGLFTSPHLVEPTERIQIDGLPVSRADFASAFDQVHLTAERLLASGQLDYHPTYFETVTAMAFLLFRGHGCHTVVLEVGMGGRLDATNVVTPLLSVITPIDYDHQAYLGETLPQIAGEKAGILKSGIPALFAPQQPEAAAVLESRACEHGIPFTWTHDWPVRELSIDAHGSRFTLQPPGAAELPVECPLAGEHQAENARTAAVALRLLGISDQAITTGIARTIWPGRLEHAATRPDIYIDGAHNPAGARELARYLRRFHAGRMIRLIFGAMRDKAVPELVETLFPLASEVIVTAPAQPRALDPASIAALRPHPGLRVIPDLGAAIAAARAASGPDDLILITGSLYLVGEARPRLVE
ncbi:MAG: bifunctional folylpolyglutamate synthase/dihydrofolate synthase [Bryobacteraceae bacterium]